MKSDQNHPLGKEKTHINEAAVLVSFEAWACVSSFPRSSSAYTCESLPCEGLQQVLVAWVS